MKSEKKISKRVLAKSVDLNLYPRDFGPLFREFFGKAALFCSRQNVEFRPAFLLVLPNTHSKHRCRCVSPLCGISDVKTAGQPHPTSGRNHGVLAMLGREKANLPLRIEPHPVKRTEKKYKIPPVSSHSLLAVFYAARQSACFSIGVRTPRLRWTRLVL